MSDLAEQSDSVQPLRRIVRPTPVARQRKMTIGRIATNSQLMANSFGRSTSIRRSISHDSSVRFPTWLMPALPSRADDLDPYRDRDIIALRQSRMKNRVVRQVQPRGLPMAAHAHGRSRSGIQTGPSSIARRLHPIHRQPNRNEAHIGPTSAPLVRVATQPQRPTARPPRTRSTNSPTRNGNRTDRDGPTRPAAKFESVLVARSLLATPRRNHSFEIDPAETAATTRSHRLSLPRVSNRQSIDRSAVHRRPAVTDQPMAMPSSRIPLSLMYVAPRRLNTPESASSSHQPTKSLSPKTSHASVGPANKIAQKPKIPSRQVSNSPTPTNIGPDWTSFPAREIAPQEVSRSAVSTVTTPLSLIQPHDDNLRATPFSTAQIGATQAPMNRFETAERDNAKLRRRARTVGIPRTPGWRQVMGLAPHPTSTTEPQVVPSTQDALFRRVAALANPSDTPIGSPGDIARRSPVSGSLFSLASSTSAAIRQKRESSLNQISSPREVQSPFDRRAQLNRAATEQTISRKANRTVGSSSNQKNSPTISRRPSKSSRSAIFRSATRSQRASFRRQNDAPPDVKANIALNSQQRPTFINLWSAVNHSVSRQSHLAARRSLRLPQTKVHSLNSKPGTIVRQQFGLDNPLPNQSQGQSLRSITHDLRSRKNNRASHALRSASRGHPSTARVVSVARQTRSHMSSITPGASSGIQFAGSLAKAISLRQTHGNIDQTVAPIRAQRLGASVATKTTTSPSIHRTPASASASVSLRTSDRANGVRPLTGAGANVAQNFLDRLSRTTGEDFAPTAISAQDRPITTNAADDVISRRPSRTARAADTVQASASLTGHSDTSSTLTSIDDQPHWAIMRNVTDNEGAIDSGSVSRTRRYDSIERASRAMSESAPVTNGTVMRSVSATQPLTKQPLATQSAMTQANEAHRSRQEIVERGGSIASRGVLHRLVSRSVPTQRLSSPLNDLPVSPNVTPGMRIPAEAMSAPPATPAIIIGSTSADVGSRASSESSNNSSVISRSVSSSPSSVSRSSSISREGRRSLSIQRKASGVQFGPSEDGSISADSLVRMIESGQSIPNQVVHRQVSGTSSSGLIRAQRTPARISRSGGSASIQRSPSSVEKAAPGPVSILNQVLSPSDDSEFGSNQVTTSQLLDLMDWINRIVDDRLRQELERRGVAGGRW